jgi:hypothetical protein
MVEALLKNQAIYFLPLWALLSLAPENFPNPGYPISVMQIISITSAGPSITEEVGKIVAIRPEFSGHMISCALPPLRVLLT